MKSKLMSTGEVVQFLLSVIVVGSLSIGMVGRPVRLVEVLTILAGSISAGIPLGRFIERRKQPKDA